MGRSSTRLAVVFLSFATALGLTTGPAEAGGNSKLCNALERIGELDLEFEDALDPSGSFDEAQEAMDDVGPKMNRAWKRVVREAPEKQAKDARLIARYTKRVVAGFREADSFEDALDVVLDGGIEAGLATLRLEEFSQDECGVSINNEGQL